jgi:ribosome-associated protein
LRAGAHEEWILSKAVFRLAVRGQRLRARHMSTAKPTAKATAAEKIEIRADPIELTQLLKFAGLFESGGEAKHAINNGAVTVNGAVETAARKKILHGDVISCAGQTLVVKSLSK